MKQMHQPNAMHTNVPVFLCKAWSDNEKHFLEVPFYDIKQASNNKVQRDTDIWTAEVLFSVLYFPTVNIAFE